MAKPRILNKKNELHFWTKHRLKIASILFSILIWFLVVSGGTFTHVMNIPIQQPLRNSNHIITSKIPDEAQIRLRGTGTALWGFYVFREAALQLDFNWANGKVVVQPAKTNVILNANRKSLEVLELVSPENIELEIEPLVEKQVNIKPGFTLKTTPGYTLVGDIQLDPAKIIIRGPKSFIDTCNYIETEHKTFQNLVRPLKKEISLLRPNSMITTQGISKVKLVANVPDSVKYKKLIHSPFYRGFSLHMQGINDLR